VASDFATAVLQLLQVSPSNREKGSDRTPLIAHHGSEDLDSAAAGAALAPAASPAAAAAAADGSSGQQDMDAIHYFGVFDGHGGADAAWHCAQRMHQVGLVRGTRCMVARCFTSAETSGNPQQSYVAWSCSCPIHGAVTRCMVQRCFTSRWEQQSCVA
jgi:hypothetical protein